jgi:hypothetical protein
MMMPMSREKKISLLAAAGATLAVLVYSVASASDSGIPPESAGCGLMEGPIVESQEFTPAESQISQSLDFLLTGAEPPSNWGLDELPGISTGVLPPLQMGMASQDAIHGYYFDREVENMLLSDFVRDGGIQVHREPMLDSTSFASHLLATLGDRAVPVEIGTHQGALVWADPDRYGSRTHNLYWSDGEHNYSLIAVLDAEEIVNLGRRLVCGG